MKKLRCALVGATGLAGQQFIAALKDHPWFELTHLAASPRSAGKSYLDALKAPNGMVGWFVQEALPPSVAKMVVQSGADLKASEFDLAFSAVEADVARELEPRLARDVPVISAASAFRYDDDVPLVVSEVNPDAMKVIPRGIVANPNCSTMQMVVALKPLHDAAHIERINVATYQSVSGAGRRAVEELGRQTARLLNGLPIEPDVFPRQIAFNVIPQIDAFQDNGYTREEMKMVWETRKILGDPNIKVNPTAVRVPVFYGHSEAVHIETRRKLTAGEARRLLEAAPGVKVLDDRTPGGYPTPVTEGANQDPVWVGRIREDLSHDRGLDLWIVSDNIRKGAALNAVQVAELLVKDYL